MMNFQKPMIRDEIKTQRAVWVEIKIKHRNLLPAIFSKELNGRITFVMSYYLEKEFFCDDYGKEWRCWATKPTDEERAAAAWE